MYILLTLFFISLLGIIFMIGRKLMMLQNGQLINKEEILARSSHLEEWKQTINKTIKQQSHKGLVVIIRLYVKFSNFVKNKYAIIKNKIKERGKKLNEAEKKEVSKFLKMISEYKHKIREIRHKIKEEEKL